MSGLIDFGEFNPPQQRAQEAFRTGAMVVYLSGGRQVGKTHYGGRTTLGVMKTPNPTVKKIGVISPTFDMARVPVEKFNELIGSNEKAWDRVKHTKKPIIYKFPGGWEIGVYSADRPNYLRGPTFQFLWIDEVAQMDEEVFDILLPSIGVANGKILATSTPGWQQHWTTDALITPARPPGHPEHNPELYDPEYAFIQGKSEENPYFNKKVLRRIERKYGKNSPLALRELQGQIVSMEGLVYKWNERNYLPASEMPKYEECAYIVGGIDFGYRSPAVALVMAYAHGMWWVMDAFYKSEVDMNDFASAIKELNDRYGVETWYADSAEPERINSLRMRGLGAVAVDKPKIVDRIREVAMFTDNNRLKVSQRAPDVKDELQLYKYPPKDRVKGDPENPENKHNHALDPIGYIIWSLRHVWSIDLRKRISRKKRQPSRDPDNELRTHAGEKRSGVTSGGKRSKKYGPSGWAGE